MRKLIIIFSVLLLGACSRLIVVPGPGKTYDDLAKDRYDCIHECTHRGWGFNAGGGAAGGWGGQRVNEDEFYACMEARGHRVSRLA